MEQGASMQNLVFMQQQALGHLGAFECTPTVLLKEQQTQAQFCPP